MCGIKDFKYCLEISIIISLNIISDIYNYLLYLRDINIELTSLLL